jgi:hypothetical protein
MWIFFFFFSFFWGRGRGVPNKIQQEDMLFTT